MRVSRIGPSAMVCVTLGLLLTGCGTFNSTLSARPAALEAPADASPALTDAPAALPPVDVTAERVAPAAPVAALEPEKPAATADVPPVQVAPTPRRLRLAQTSDTTAPPADVDTDEYDPWERFNEKMFAFNYNLDRYVLKPVARGYRFVLPDQVQIMIDNGFNNIAFVPRFVNSLLQAKWEGALREVSRFVINSTLGFGGLFDAAKSGDIRPSKEDFGQTLGVWGVGPGPYLVIPLLGPMTVRDGIGRGVDGLMNPLNYYIPFFWDQLGMKLGETVNDRALNYELFQGVEETTIDLYSSVRHFYLKRREQQIKE